jgi:hypothetical protein
MADDCSNCKYAYGPVVVGSDGGQFWCRRYPPHGHHPEWHSCFPLVPGHGQWCGEYKHGDPAPVGG